MKLIFAGTPANAAQALEALAQQHEIVLVITRKDAPFGRKKELRPSEVAQTAARLGIPTLKANKITSANLQQLRDCGAEMAIVVAYGALIPSEALELFDWWNLHFSLLPKWRGATPLQHSIMHHGEGAGITIFKIDQGLDTGDIICQQPVEILEGESTLAALPRFTALGSDLLLAALEQPESLKKQQGEPSFAPKIGRDQARIDFNESAASISAKVQALNPEPVAWALIDDLPIRIIEAHEFPPMDLQHDLMTKANGSVALEKSVALVKCGGEALLQLLVVQPAGKQPMNAADWIRGQNRELRFE